MCGGTGPSVGMSIQSLSSSSVFDATDGFVAFAGRESAERERATSDGRAEAALGESG